jgi:hypothetical protein
MNKASIINILIISQFVIICVMVWEIVTLKSTTSDQIDSLKKSIIASDSLQKEAAGQYAKLVDYYKSERDLIEDLRDNNDSLYQLIDANGERVLSIARSIISLDKKVVAGFAKPDPLDTNTLNLSLRYPSEKSPFVLWDGSINKSTAAYRGKFSFGQLPLGIVLTEESRGLWKTRLIGPSWLRVDSLSIMSLPPEEYTPAEPKRVQFLVGGTYFTRLNIQERAIGVNFGVNLFDRHNILVGANSLQQLSFGYTYKIKSFKKK